MNLRNTLTTPQARRCSAAAVATATAALLLTPATALASGRPAGPERPASVGAAAAPAGTGHGTGHGTGQHSTGGHGTGGHSANRHSSNHHGADSHSANGHGGQSSHQSGSKTGRKVGKLGKKAAHKAARAGIQHHPVHRAVAGVDGGTGSKPAGTGNSGSNASAPGGSSSKPSSGSTGDPTSPNSSSPSKKTPPQPSGPASDPKKAPQSGPMATVTRLSMSKNLTSTRPLNFAARVSPAHRMVGAPRETGTVDFTVDGSSSGPIAVANNRASVKVKLSPGKHTASAKYSGDSSHSPSDSGPMSFTVS